MPIVNTLYGFQDSELNHMSSEGVLAREQEGRQASKHKEGIQSEPCPGGAC